MTDYDALEWAKSGAEHAATKNAERTMVRHLALDHAMSVHDIAQRMHLWTATVEEYLR